MYPLTPWPNHGCTSHIRNLDHNCCSNPFPYYGYSENGGQFTQLTSVHVVIIGMYVRLSWFGLFLSLCLWFSCNNLGYLFCKNFNIRCKQIHDVIFRFILSIKLKVFEPLKLYSCLKIKLINLNNRIFSSTIWLFHWHLF